MKFTLTRIKNLVKEALEEKPTGDFWLDSRYDAQLQIQGHRQPYYKLFYLIAREFKPECVVELGSFQGLAAAHFAAGNPFTTVITIDIHKDDKAAQQETINAAAHWPNLTYLNKWTWDVVPDDIPKPIDILFIDAWHDYKYVKMEEALYFPLLSENALVICDDITTAHNFDGMVRFWEELDCPKFLDDKLHCGIPMGFMKKCGSK